MRTAGSGLAHTMPGPGHNRRRTTVAVAPDLQTTIKDLAFVLAVPVWCVTDRALRLGLHQLQTHHTEYRRLARTILQAPHDETTTPSPDPEAFAAFLHRSVAFCGLLAAPRGDRPQRWSRRLHGLAQAWCIRCQAWGSIRQPQYHRPAPAILRLAGACARCGATASTFISWGNTRSPVPSRPRSSHNQQRTTVAVEPAVHQDLRQVAQRLTVPLWAVTDWALCLGWHQLQTECQDWLQQQAPEQTPPAPCGPARVRAALAAYRATAFPDSVPLEEAVPPAPVGDGARQAWCLRCQGWQPVRQARYRRVRRHSWRLAGSCARCGEAVSTFVAPREVSWLRRMLPR